MESFFSNFEFVFELLAENRKYSNEWRSVNIDQIAMCYISMNSSRRALQTNGKLFIISESFFKLVRKN